MRICQPFETLFFTFFFFCDWHETCCAEKSLCNVLIIKDLHAPGAALCKLLIVSHLSIKSPTVNSRPVRVHHAWQAICIVSNSLLCQSLEISFCSSQSGISPKFFILVLNIPFLNAIIIIQKLLFAQSLVQELISLLLGGEHSYHRVAFVVKRSQ